jgi:hypothetical protein
MRSRRGRTDANYLFATGSATPSWITCIDTTGPTEKRLTPKRDDINWCS